MAAFRSFYDTNHDGRLMGFERVRYEEANISYPGSPVPDYINEEYERRLSVERDNSRPVRKSKGATSSYDDYSDDYEDSYDDWDGGSEGEVLDDEEDFGPEEQYWFAPKDSEDLVRAVDSPRHLEGPRLHAHRCYNCVHWDYDATCTCTRDYGCEIFYDKNLDEYMDGWCPPDEDGEVCERFRFRHGNRG